MKSVIKEKTKDFMLWSLSFTKKVITAVTVVWIFCVLYSAAMILFAVIKINDFSYLDTFINDYGETFRLIVGINIVSKTVENIFKYNEGGLFGKSTNLEPGGKEHD